MEWEGGCVGGSVVVSSPAGSTFARSNAIEVREGGLSQAFSPYPVLHTDNVARGNRLRVSKM